MRLTYDPPTKNEKGLYVFSKQHTRMTNNVQVSSVEDYLTRQGKILEVTKSIADVITNHEVGTGVEGDAEIRFKVYEANMRILGMFVADGLNVIGEMGFPEFRINTNYGNVSISLSPSMGPTHIKASKPYEVRSSGLSDRYGGLATQIRAELTDAFRPLIQARSGLRTSFGTK
ncbi:hypothetical protein HYV85_04175 [Candidatus Woesearchaeota archaeon]|nr:hypothetical protein [Candidatus Woesearchaeota archaeon]